MTKAIPAADTKFYLSKLGSTATVLVPTAISSANPAVVDLPATTGVLVGDVVFMSDTGFVELDGKGFEVEAVTLTDVTLKNADLSASVGTLAATPKMSAWSIATDFELFCLSTFSREAGTADTVSVGTFCDSSATIAGVADAGSVSFAGFMDPSEKGYVEFMKAADDRKERTLLIVLPDNIGNIVMRGTVNSFSESFDLGNAISWTSGLSLASNPSYIWN